MSDDVLSQYYEMLYDAQEQNRKPEKWIVGRRRFQQLLACASRDTLELALKLNLGPDQTQPDRLFGLPIEWTSGDDMALQSAPPPLLPPWLVPDDLAP